MRSCRVSRSAGDMFTTICFRVIIAVVRAFTAVSRAILSRRIISTAPSAVLGIAVDWPASTERAAASASMAGLAGGAAQAPVASIHFQRHDARRGERPAPGRRHSCRCLRCRRPRSVRGCPPTSAGPDSRLHPRRTAQADAPGVDHHRDVDMLVGIYPRQSPPAPRAAWSCCWSPVGLLSCGGGLARVGGQDCDEPWVQQAPIGSRPIRSAGCRTSYRRAMTDRSVARTVGQSSCGSGHHPPAPTSVTERPRQAGGSCSQSS